MMSQQMQISRAKYCERQTPELFDHLPRGGTPATRLSSRIVSLLISAKILKQLPYLFNRLLVIEPDDDRTLFLTGV